MKENKIEHNRWTKPDCSEEYWNTLTDDEKAKHQEEGIHVISKNCWCNPQLEKWLRGDE